MGMKHDEAVDREIEDNRPVPLPVVFRMDEGEVLALFPTFPADRNGYQCMCYSHVGQHSGADYHGVINRSRPATAEESAPLHRELERIGYYLRPVKRASYQMHEECRRDARETARNA